jgi:hypothetical protein
MSRTLFVFDSETEKYGIAQWGLLKLTTGRLSDVATWNLSVVVTWTR